MWYNKNMITGKEKAAGTSRNFVVSAVCHPGFTQKTTNSAGSGPVFVQIHGFWVNPVKYTDPDGRSIFDSFKIFTNAAGLIFGLIDGEASREDLMALSSLAVGVMNYFGIGTIALIGSVAVVVIILYQFRETLFQLYEWGKAFYEKYTQINLPVGDKNTNVSGGLNGVINIRIEEGSPPQQPQSPSKKPTPLPPSEGKPEVNPLPPPSSLPEKEQPVPYNNEMSNR